MADKPIKQIKKDVQVTVQKDFFVCPECGKEHPSIVDADKCSQADRKREEARRKVMDAAYKKAVRVIEKMPQVDEAEYAKEAIQIALSYCPEIYPCVKCGHPHMNGYQCETPGCDGGDLDIDDSDLFHDEAFELPDGAIIVLYPPDSNTKTNK